jgi:eukaryotic-like serine/threonine-protein kinase
MSPRNVIVTAALTSLIVSICTFFALDYVKSQKHRPKEVIVPQVVGLKPSQAMEVLDGRQLRMQIIERRADPQVPAGQICSQHPLPESKLLAHSAVSVVLSSGQPKLPIPACTGVSLQDFTAALTRAQLKLGKLQEQATDVVKPGQVVSCDPPAGQTVNPGAEVAVVVAKQPDPGKEVPKLKGMNCKSAQKAIEEAGFVVGEVKWRVYDAPPFLVMSQTPDPKTMAKPGTKIDLSCSAED